MVSVKGKNRFYRGYTRLFWVYGYYSNHGQTTENNMENKMETGNWDARAVYRDPWDRT